MYGLKSLDLEFLGDSNLFHGVAFPSLEVLEFKDMMDWEEGSTSGGDKCKVFPCLREMSIEKCPKLDVVAMESIPTITVLHLEECSLAVLISMVGASSSISRLTIQNIEGLTQLQGKVLQHLKAVDYLSVSNCGELTYLWESGAKAYENLSSLKTLEVRGCANLVSLEENNQVHLKFVTEVTIVDCLRLKSFNCPNNIEKLAIINCPLATSLSFPTMDGLSSSLNFLEIWSCNNMEVNWLDNKFLSSLESLRIYGIPNLRLFPKGCLAHLTKLSISWCDKIESIPDNGYGFLPFLCLRELLIHNCKNLKSFPQGHLQNLTYLEDMWIRDCPSLDVSFPCGLWPPNLSCLEIGRLKKPISEWGLQNFPTSLVSLFLYGDENSDGVVSFAAKAEEDKSGSSASLILPSSLTYLCLSGFKELESISEGLQHLTCLQHLEIDGCPKLRDLPETLLPSLSCLEVYNSSPDLKKKCRRGKGKYWSKISAIPDLRVL